MIDESGDVNLTPPRAFSGLAEIGAPSRAPSGMVENLEASVVDQQSYDWTEHRSDALSAVSVTVTTRVFRTANSQSFRLVSPCLS